jgi:hypothetical protein
LRTGVKVKHEGIELPDGQMMKEIDEEGYKYLGVLEGADIKNREMKEKVRVEYLRRVKLLAKSKLYAGNLIRGINAWAIGVVRYSAGIPRIRFPAYNFDFANSFTLLKYSTRTFSFISLFLISAPSRTPKYLYPSSSISFII